MPAGPGVVLDPGIYGRSLVRGNREISGSAIGAVMAGWSVTGRWGAEAADARSREVWLRQGKGRRGSALRSSTTWMSTYSGQRSTRLNAKPHRAWMAWYGRTTRQALSPGMRICTDGSIEAHTLPSDVHTESGW